MKLLVVIPTWNRANHLDKAIGAIAAARAVARAADGACEVELFISNNCSTDHTVEVVARWQDTAPWIHLRTWEEHTSNWPQIVNRAFSGSALDYDYAWLQGDDDWITDDTAYQQVMQALEAGSDQPPAILHCCQARRALPGDARILSGLTEDLCNTYGWHDLLGWISSLVISRDTVTRMLASPQFAMSSHSAYFHSEILLEAAYGQPMLILARGLIDQQDEKQTAECMERWAKAGVGAAYWGIIPGLLNMKERGVLTAPLTIAFFRYLTYSFWDRFSVETMTLAVNRDTPEEIIATKLQLLGHFTNLLGYGEDRKLYQNWLEGFTDDIHEVRESTNMIFRRLESLGRPSYSFELLSSRD